MQTLICPSLCLRSSLCKSLIPEAIMTNGFWYEQGNGSKKEVSSQGICRVQYGPLPKLQEEAGALNNQERTRDNHKTNLLIQRHRGSTRVATRNDICESPKVKGKRLSYVRLLLSSILIETIQEFQICCCSNREASKTSLYRLQFQLRLSNRLLAYRMTTQRPLTLASPYVYYA